MKKLLLLLLLSFLSLNSLAKEGDLYLCEITNHQRITASDMYGYRGNVEIEPYETFIFEKKKDAIILKNFFYATALSIIVNENDEEFYGNDSYHNFYYRYGRFSYTAGVGNGAFIVLAKCKII